MGARSVAELVAEFRQEGADLLNLGKVEVPEFADRHCLELLYLRHCSSPVSVMDSLSEIAQPVPDLPAWPEESLIAGPSDSGQAVVEICHPRYRSR